MPKRHSDLRTQGGYTDTYVDTYFTEGLFHIPRRQHMFAKPSREPFAIVTPIIEAEAEGEPDGIWAAIDTVWVNRGTYSSQSDFEAALVAALTAAGYTGPGGAAL